MCLFFLWVVQDQRMGWWLLIVFAMDSIGCWSQRLCTWMCYCSRANAVKETRSESSVCDVYMFRLRLFFSSFFFLVLVAWKKCRWAIFDINDCRWGFAIDLPVWRTVLNELLRDFVERVKWCFFTKRWKLFIWFAESERKKHLDRKLQTCWNVLPVEHQQKCILLCDIRTVVFIAFVVCDGWHHFFFLFSVREKFITRGDLLN